MDAVMAMEGTTISNWGPLTTTFTAPSSCATATTNLLIAYNTSLPLWLWAVQCETLGYWDCIPTGTVTITESVGRDGHKPHLIPEHYFSPGVDCPAGWETMGVAAKGEKKSISASGILHANPDSPHTGLHSLELKDYPVKRLIDMLKPNETLAVCCPSSFTPLAGVACFSTVPSYKPTRGCPAYPEATKAAMAATATKQDREALYTTFDDKMKPSLVGLRVVHMANLIHHTSDVMAKATTEAATTSPKKENGATKLSPGSDTWYEPTLILGLCIISLMCGITDLASRW